MSAIVTDSCDCYHGTKRRVRYHGWPTDKFIKVRDFKIIEIFKKRLFSFLCQECCSETRVYVGLT